MDPTPFIVGHPRSGTTLLRLMLDAHPDLAIPPETGFVEAVAARPDMTRNEVFRTITTYPPDAPGWADFHLDARLFKARLDAIENFTAPEGVREFYRMYAERFGKPRWGDKTPVHGTHIRAISSLLPEARFVHLIRDGRDAAASLRKQWFAPGREVSKLASHWRNFINTIREQSRGVPHYLEVRFEDMIRNPRRILETICDFIEISFAPEMLRHEERAAQRLSEHLERRRADGAMIVTREARQKQQLNSRRPPDPALIGKGAAEFTAAELMEFDEVAGELLTHLGYNRIGP